MPVEKLLSSCIERHNGLNNLVQTDLMHRDDDVEKLKWLTIGTILLDIVKYKARSDMSRLISKMSRERLICLQALVQRTNELVNAGKKTFCFVS